LQIINPSVNLHYPSTNLHYPPTYCGIGLYSFINLCKCDRIFYWGRGYHRLELDDGQWCGIL